MCGISGLVDKRGRPVEPARVEGMTDIVLHRGPDGFGYHYSRNIGLGHRRLAIIDLTERGRQPMSLAGKYWITYNGEIYNYLELRRELESGGHKFVTDSDTEVILAAYAAWGPQCLHRFNGMWAFAIYDVDADTIFLARDRFGVKPLYYLDTPEEFGFGSEIKQLILLQRSARANQKMVVEWMLTSIDGHTEDTFFEGIKALPQGHHLTYRLSAHDFRIERWYSIRIDQSDRALTDEDAVRKFRDLFEDSVRLRLRSDVLVGTCLSGGLDSSATSAVAAGIYRAASKQSITAIHARSTESATDESAFAVTVARHLGIDLTMVVPTVDDFVSTIDEVVRTQEEPFGSPSMFMGWQVFREAKKRGCKVMLNGQGGDEVLLGYERYLAAFLSGLPPGRMVRELFLQKAHTGLRIRELLAQYLYFRYAGLRVRRLKSRSFVRGEIKNQHDFEAVRASAESFRSVLDLQVHEIGTLQLPHLLRYEDRGSMRHSVETRLPFLDFRLVEFGVSLRTNMKIRDGWTKYVLRCAIDQDLPREIAWRRNKLGFQAPDKTWLVAYANQMKDEISHSRLLGEIVDTRALLARFDSLSLKERWCYFCVAVWERVYAVSWA